MEKCYKGLSEEAGNTKGKCCCNCVFQSEIHGHMDNKMVGGRLKGPISSIAGWGCSNPEVTEGKFIIFFEEKHSICEVHKFK